MNQQISRRDFTKAIMTLAGSIMGAVVALPGIAYLVSPGAKAQKSESWKSLGAFANYPVGDPTAFSFTTTRGNGWEKTVKSSTVYVLRGAGDDVRVFSNICTHLSCNASWHKDVNHYICPCHDAHYAIDGAVVSGPAPRPLDQYEAKIESGNLLIHFSG
ncbi:MAG: ubiquinol-cytochrome c reductase iron-sulfur subunit [Chloroflexi bacterium]|nr:ubiquinol-cytochrome c reductase iron-sulfur subunit [Chloroflexota bacterium]MCL5273256.1 ubiquinol-cytochrome c reductase iron-sulfur subunit [Chloroflexota bacterium]